MKKLIWLAVVVILGGCVAVKQTAPPLPPKVPVKKFAKQAARVSVASVTPPAQPNTLYLQREGDGLVLSWQTNVDNWSFVLQSANLTAVTEQWQAPGITNGASINAQGPQLFYRLVTASTNSLGFGWSYDFLDGVDGFVLRYGNASGAYSHTNTVGKRLWMTQALPTLETNWFFTLTARISTNGVESLPSNELRWPRTQ